MAGVSDDELYRQYETINLYRRGPGARVELNRPGRMNAWNRQFSAELGVPGEVLTSRLGTPSESNAGLIGYLHSVMEGA